jgi:hypothetical protein
MVDIRKLKPGEILISSNGKVYGPVGLIDEETELIGIKTKDGTRPFKPGEVDYLHQYLRRMRESSQPNIGREMPWKGFALSLLRKGSLTPGEEEVLRDLEQKQINEVRAQELLEFMA